MTQTAGEIYAANYRRRCRLKLSKTLLYSYMEYTASTKQPSSLDPDKCQKMGHNSDMSHIPNNTGHVDSQCQDAEVRVRILKRPPMPPQWARYSVPTRQSERRFSRIHPKLSP